MKNSTMLSVTRFLQFIVISILLFSLAMPKQAMADVAAGISEYFIPGSADQLRAILVDNDNDLTDNNLHFVITVPVSTNNVRVYFDHWENGYGTGATGYDEAYTPTKGQVLTFESPTVPANPRGSTLAACAGSSNPSGSTSNCYDGRDRIYIEGGAVAVAAAFWPSTTGSVYANAWEIYPTKPDQTSYTIPVGEDLFALGTYYADFDNVYVLVQALVDGTIVNVNNPTGADLTNIALSRGQVTQLYHIGAGTTVTSNAGHPVQVQIITGQPNPTPYWESRSYTVVPSSLWDNEYYSPVASSTTANADIFIYNPTGASLVVTYQDSSVPAGATITIPAGATRSFRALSGHYVPQNSSVYLTALSNFWAIGTYDPGGADRNWGYSLIPVNTLTMEYYVGWAPGSTDLTANGSPVFVTTTQNNTTVYVDNPPADGVADATYPLNRLQILKLRSGNNNTGMHIWATSPIAVMWGQDGGYSSAGNPYIDAGYTVLPLNSSWIDVVVGSQKTASPTSISYKSGQEVTFTITTTSGFVLTRLDVADTLPTGLSYKNNSSSITGPSGFTSSANPSVSGQTLTWADILGTGLASGESVIVQFTAVTNTDLAVDTLTNINNSTGYYSSRSFTSSSNANVDVLYPDLTVTKTNNTAGTIALGNSFDWSLLVANTAGEAAAQFSAGQTILSDSLPAGPLYGAPVVTQTGGVSGTVACSIASNILTCTASGGTVAIPVGQTLTVDFTIIPTAAGSLVNPTGGACAVDPSNNISEGSAGEANNACANTVTVTSSGGTCPVARVNLATWATFGDQTSPYTSDTGSGSITIGAGLGGQVWTLGNPNPGLGIGNWPNGAPANVNTTTEYVQLAATTMGFTDIQVAYNYERDNNQGPTSLDFYYSSNGSTYSQLTGTNTVAQNSWGLATRDFASVPAIDNNVNSTFRFIAYGSGNNNDGRKLGLDNIIVSGCPITNPPTVTKSFDPASISAGGTSTLRVDFVNPNSGAALSGLSISDTYPSGIVNTTPAVITNTCGGTLTADDGVGGFSLAGGSLAASGSCYIEIDVTTASQGTYNNTTSQVFTIESGLGSTASATLTVTPAQGTIVVDKVTIPAASPASFDFTTTGTGYTGFSLTDADSPNSQALAAGAYTVTETPESGFVLTDITCTGATLSTVSIGSDSDFDAGDTSVSITLAPSETVNCIFTSTTVPQLTVIKHVINDNGGLLEADDFTITVDDPGTDPAPFSGVESPGTTIVVDPGNYSVSESPVSSYAVTYSADCSGTIALGETKTCTVTNNDVAPRLTLNGIIVNNNGGTADETAITLTADGPVTDLTGPGAAGLPDVTSGGTFQSGTYDLSSTGPSGYTAGNWSCTLNGTPLGNVTAITLAVGDVGSCDITYDDIPATLTLVKTVTNNNGGLLTAAGFPAFINGNPVTWGVAETLNAGSYTASETNQSGYSAGTWGGDCATDGSVTLAVGNNKTCTITNNDVAPSLTLTNSVTNDDGGTAAATAWTLTANGPTTLAGTTPVASDGTFSAGTYTLSQTGGPAAGYTTGTWSCVGGTFTAPDQITIGLGESVSCSIANNDIPPTLRLVKNVTNDDGGDAQSSDWTLTATGTPRGYSDAGDSTAFHTVTAGVGYTLSESVISGYTAGSWSCDGGSLVGDEITLGLDEDVTCQITNDDVAPTLTLNGTILNNNGGSEDETSLALSADGGLAGTLSGPGTPGTPDVSSDGTFQSGTYNLSSTGPAGYTAGNWSCTINGTSIGDVTSITLGAGDAGVCEIVYDDQPATLVIIKNLITDAGGTETVDDFTFSYNGGPAIAFETDGQVDMTVSAGVYFVSEPAVAGYNTTYSNCSGVVANGGSAMCTITNDDIAPKLNLFKWVTNDNGGSLAFTDFTPSIDGNPASWNTIYELTAGTHTVSESSQAGYTPSEWAGDCAADGSITLALGAEAGCNINNNDNPASLSLTNSVTNDDGGTANATDWILSATGPSTITGTTPVNSGSGFVAGTYTLTQTGGPAGGYTTGAWSCVGGTFTAPDQVVVGIGETVSCSIANEDIPPTLRLQKLVTTDNGGTATAGDWTLTATGTPRGFSDAGASTSFHTVTAGVGYTLSESVISGYTAGSWSCDGGSLVGDMITLGLDEDVTCQLINNDIAPHLTLNGIIVNDNGGTEIETSISLTADGPVTDLTGPGAAGSTDVVSNGTFQSGTYDLSSTGPAGYTAGNWSCTVNGSSIGDVTSVTLGIADVAVCEISYDDQPATLTLNKIVVSNYGGTLTPGDFPAFINVTPVDWGVANMLNAGSYTASETSQSGYSASIWSGDCAADGSLTLSVGDTKTCSITNTDQPGTLIVKKVVINDNGGSLSADDFTFSVNSGAATVFELDGQNDLTVDAGTYTVTEGAVSGYTTSYSNCSSLVIPNGGSETCTITNDDDVPSLTLTNSVTNDDGGTAAATAWTLTANGPTTLTGTTPVASDGTFSAGTYTLSQTSGPASGYTTGTWSCVGGTFTAPDQIVIGLGESVSCSIANNDIPPTLRLVKNVTNDDGGDAQSSNWTLTATGTPRGFSDAGDSTAFHTVTAGVGYTLSESVISGYTAGSWSCDGGSLVGDEITLGLDEDVTCQITNNDVAAKLTIIVVVVNDDGGSALPDDFDPTVGGTVVTSGTEHTYSANTLYAIDETLLNGYTFISITGDQKCPALLAGTITLDEGDDITCTITNDDVAPKLALTKTVVNDNGGSAVSTDFTPSIDGNIVAWNIPMELIAGTHNASESSLTAYAAGTWGGDCAADGSITLSVGDELTCSITNDDIAPSLTLHKNVINNNGGTATAGQWTLTAVGSLNIPTNLSGSDGVASGANFLADTYTLGESGGSSGYTASDYSCVINGGLNPVNGNSVALGIGDTADCTVTNNDQPGTLIVNKVLPNDNGGTATADEFSFAVNGGPGVTFEADGTNLLTVDAGTYTVTEGAVSGYTTSYSNCSSLVIPNGGSETCTITNDDDVPSLTLTNSVTNDDGGTAAATAWTLTANGPTTLTGTTPVASDGTFSAGTYTLSQTGGPASGYTTGTWSCVGGTFTAPDQIVIGLGESVSCSIANNDIPPTLRLVKNVTNDDGGDAQSSDWTLTATGTPRGFSDAGDSTAFHTVTAGVGYTLSESMISGYSAGSWSCDGGSLVGDEITLGLDEDVTCQITNNDVAATLTVIKVVNNNHGGTLTADDFSFQVNSSGAISFESDGQNDLTVNAGTYTVTEPTVTGYATTYDNCSGVVLTSGGNTTCTITNSDIAPMLTLEKTVMNNNAGTLVKADFPAFIGGMAVVWDIPATVDQAGTYTVSETQQSGYIASTWGGDCAADGSITLAIGDNKTCAITNDDHNPVIHLEKSGALDITVVTPAGMVDAGDEIDYDFEVTNLGNIELSNINITDSTPACDAAPVYGSGDTNTNNLLDLTETWHFNCTHTITQAEIESGLYSNTATVTGTSSVNGDVTDDDADEQSFTLVDELIVTKTSDTTSVTAAEQVVSYTITLVNGGNTTLSNINVTDAKCNSAPVYQSGDINEDHLMQPTEDWIYTCSYTVTQGDIDSGEDISNTVFADATEIDPAEEDTLDIPIVQGPAIELTKTGSLEMTVVAPDTLTNPGDTITYSFSVENTGNVTLWNDITVTDSLLTTLVCIIPVSDAVQFPAGFNPGATAVCNPSNNVYTLTLDDITFGSVLNTATANTTYGTDPVTDDDEVTTETLPVREISLTKTPSVTTFKSVGDIITYTYTITNTGNLDLFPVYTIVDDKIALVDCPLTPDPLTPGASLDCTGDYIITQEDLDAGAVINHATAFANYTPACTGGCVLAQAGSDATINKEVPQPENTAAVAAMVTLPATGFAPDRITILSGKPESYADTELTISIPVLGVKTSITGVSNRNGNYVIDWLWQDVGWLQGTAYPGSIGNSVLTAHVYLPNGRPGPFVDLKTLKWGQQIIVEQNGKSYIYEVRSIKRVKPEDLIPVGHKDYGYLTLITCQGYDQQSESYLYRTVVQAVLVDIK